jgi:hypothetical protein
VGDQNEMPVASSAEEIKAKAPATDGLRLVSVGREHMVQVYTLNVNDLIGVAQSRLTRVLIQDEYIKYLHVAQCPAELAH